MGMDTVEVKPIILEIPFTPPSVNHYKVPVTIRTRNGPKKTFMLTPEALAFHRAVGVFARGRTLVPRTAQEKLKIRYRLIVTVFLGEGERGDGDNFWKCIGDALQRAGVIHSDARARLWHLEVEDADRGNPRTLICVCLATKGKTLAEKIRDGEEK